MALAQPDVQEEPTAQPPRPALPLLALLALASALGIAVAVALAGVAMLLATPAYAEEGNLLLERRAGLVEAERLYAEAQTLEDGSTLVVEVYQNTFAERLSGVYLYRLPADTVLERLSFALRDAEPRPAVLTRRRGAALLERTAEIGPGETLQVELEYRRAPASGARLLTLR